MASTASYQHSPLEYEDSIRVLLLLPSTNPEDPIRIELAPCRLSEVELHTHSDTDSDADYEPEPTPNHEDGVKYEALSYAWGDLKDVVPIYVGEGMAASLLVTRNCLQALKALRLKDRPRRMWIDAICIDQTNLEERSSQVRMMARIYAAGWRTVIYLGEHTPSSRVVFESVSVIVTQFSIYSGQDAFWENLPKLNPELTRGLDDLTQRPWFRRVWVAQEVFMNKKRLILCGESTVPYQILDFMFQHYGIGREPGGLMPFSWEPELVLEIYGASPEKTGIRDRLWHSLLTSRELLASDSRDKIFAMKALIGNQHVELDPLIDYKKTPEQVFTLLANVFLHRFGLKILGLVRHGHNLHMPSWVPDWSQNTPLSRKLMYNFELASLRYFDEDVESEVESIDGKVQPREWSLSETNMLRVRGWPLGHLVELGDAFSFRDLHDARQQLYSVACLMEEDWGQDTAEKQDLITARKHFPEKIFPALIASKNARSFLSRGWGFDPSLLPEFKHAEQAMSILEIRNSLQECRVFLSDDGHIGIVPQIAEEGDVLARLEVRPGQTTSMILRPAHEGRWRLISGDCYAVRIDGNISNNVPGEPEEFILS